MARGVVSSLQRFWKKTTTMEKVFYIAVVLIGVYIITTYGQKTIENFEQSTQFITKKGPECYDDFYVSVYDDLLYSKIKNDYEIGTIINKAGPTAQSRILDIGSGTGHHVNELTKQGYNCEGIDLSTAMVKQAKQNYPKCKFTNGDAMKTMTYPGNSFTTITCLYFTIYAIQNKRGFFQNCYHWLMPGGYLVIHLVDRDNFDPILPAADVFYVDPQKFAEKRITQTKVSFDNHDYKANFKSEGDTSYFEEVFVNKKDKSIRKNSHILYMPTQKHILALAQETGFIMVSKSEMKKPKYYNQFIYVLQKPE